MEFIVNQDLSSLHTMGCRSTAQSFVVVYSLPELKSTLEEARQRALPITVLGGGSNVVFSEHVPGLVVKMGILGIEVLENFGSEASVEDAEVVWVKAQAGENWHHFVRWTLQQGLGGLENLSLIPGTVGAAPIQNIGAYGVEVKDVISEVSAINRNTGELKIFDRDECGFRYRDSIFKRDPGKWIIVEVTFRLSPKAPLKLDYAELKKFWESAGEPSSYLEVGALVEEIRRRKLPDPDVVPNSGSFFKNPTVDDQLYQRILDEYPSVVAFPSGVNQWKLAAGWLIQECGWKGFVDDGVGVFDRQALVIINPGYRPAAAIKGLASKIQQSVADKFGVELEIEPFIL
ncbi:UDP-N-acetylenolpyruvoylglucosamine reductase [Hahella sp. CCB-MM4]|uniref:UDP-N-acetylmuramate dehydrogenase n=1 Tax=Hahella sp. (strain CCB-MM4) TaxID=1926491 RepID=UPI000B9B7009|nr:UDP-N-acetylmuramate dehydrogenase [Hahella sp. CCB-MM4]OZG73451.1 UDP-N-acetylenolpyruvoylglucosamine reductase [Hahella sp. CCB-MM4]